MAYWLERSLVKQEDLGSLPAKTKCFFSPRVLGGRNEIDPDMINCMILHIHGENKIILSHAI